MRFSDKLHRVATFAFLVVWVGRWGRLGGEVITFVRTISTTSSENTFHKLRRISEKACLRISMGDY